MIDKLFHSNSNPKPNHECHWSPPPDHDIHRFNELLDMIDHPVNTDDYKVPLKQTPVNPTHSVVGVHQPQLAPPDLDHEEAPQRQIERNISKSYTEQNISIEETEV